MLQEAELHFLLRFYTSDRTLFRKDANLDVFLWFYTAYYYKYMYSSSLEALMGEIFFGVFIFMLSRII